MGAGSEGRSKRGQRTKASKARWRQRGAHRGGACCCCCCAASTAACAAGGRSVGRAGRAGRSSPSLSTGGICGRAARQDAACTTANTAAPCDPRRQTGDLNTRMQAYAHAGRHAPRAPTHPHPPVDVFDEGHLRRVALPDAGAHHPRVAPLAARVARRQLLEQLVQLRLAVDYRGGGAPCVDVALRSEHTWQGGGGGAQEGLGSARPPQGRCAAGMHCLGVTVEGLLHDGPGCCPTPRGVLPPRRTCLPSVMAWSATRRSSLAFCTVVSMRSCLISCVTIVLHRGEGGEL